MKPGKNAATPAPKGSGVVVTHASVQISGPLPPPEAFRGYEDVVPGAADRILKMAEGEQVHRHQVETRQLRYTVSLAALGQVFALTIGLSGIVSGAVLALRGQNLNGLAFLVTSLATLVGVYIHGQRKASRAPKPNT